MSTLFLRRALPSVAAFVLLATPLLPVQVAAAQAAAPSQRSSASASVVAAAAGWLAGELSPEGTVKGSFPGENGGPPVEFTDYGRSLDSALALLAAGGQDGVLGHTLGSVSNPDPVAEYTQGAPADLPDAAYVGATAKLALVVELTGGDAAAVGGVDLLAQLRSLAQSNGRFADRSSFGNFGNLFGHAFALLALDSAGQAVDDALVQGLIDSQCDDGSFPEGYEPAAAGSCTGSVDATGLVLQALGALDLSEADSTRQAAAWLVGQQQADGSFPGEAPVNSTGYAVLGLNAVGVSAGGAVPYLVSQQNTDGGLRRGAGADTGSDLFATAQALPALTGNTFQDSARNVARLAAPVTATPAPATPVTPAAPAPGSNPTVTAPTAPAAATGSEPARSPAVARPLPRTGGDGPPLLLTGLVLVAAGGAIMTAGRPRRRGRHAAAR